MTEDGSPPPPLGGSNEGGAARESGGIYHPEEEYGRAVYFSVANYGPIRGGSAEARDTVF